MGPKLIMSFKRKGEDIKRHVIATSICFQWCPATGWTDLSPVSHGPLWAPPMMTAEQLMSIIEGMGIIQLVNYTLVLQQTRHFSKYQTGEAFHCHEKPQETQAWYVFKWRASLYFRIICLTWGHVNMGRSLQGLWWLLQRFYEPPHHQNLL